MRFQDPNATKDNEEETLVKISQLFTAYGGILWQSACPDPETAGIKKAIQDTIKNFHPTHRRQALSQSPPSGQAGALAIRARREKS